MHQRVHIARQIRYILWDMAVRDFDQEIKTLSATLVSIEKVVDLPKLRSELQELEAAAGVPNLWDNPEEAQKVTSKLSRVQSEINRISGLRQRLDDLPEIGRAHV